MAEKEPSPIMVTPVSQKRPRNTESPSWLPDGWRMDVKVRTSGATAGVTDRFYISPSGQRFRSKVEVLHFLETGSKRRKMKSGADADASPASDRQETGEKDLLDFSSIKFDFKNPPQRVTWVFRGDEDDEWNWNPMIGNTAVPDAEEGEWVKTYIHLAHLESEMYPTPEMSYLWHLSVSSNWLSGSIPSEIGLFD